MKTKIKAVMALAAISLLAVPGSAFAKTQVSLSVNPSGEFQVGGGFPASLTGVPLETPRFVFSEVGSFTCAASKMTISGSIFKDSLALLTPSYGSGCYLGGLLPASISMNSCTFGLRAPTISATIDMQILCNEGDAIRLSAAPYTSCEVTIPTQNVTENVQYKNVGTEALSEVEATEKLTGIEYTASAACKGAGTFKTGTSSARTRISAWK